MFIATKSPKACWGGPDNPLVEIPLMEFYILTGPNLAWLNTG
jgi:hypothetical protein